MRFRTAHAIKILNNALELPATGQEQDWDIELADAKRIQEFIDFYSNSDWNEDELFALMSLIIASYDETIREHGHQPEIWEQIAKQLLQQSELHESTLEYWACLDEDIPEYRFYISPYIRELLADIEAADK